MLQSLRRRTISFSTWFCLGPAYGMQTHEMLSGGSAILLSPFLGREKPRTGLHKVNILTCSHVMHPFDYPHYYPNDFLKNIKPEHIKCSIDCRDDAGQIQAVVDCGDNQFLDIQQKHFHPSRDLCCLEAMVDSAFLEATDVFDLQDIFNSDSEKTLQLDEELFFFGHNMTTADDLNVPELIRGSYVDSVQLRDSRNPETCVNRSFAATEHVCQMGMCGGAVVSTEGMLATNSLQGNLRGMIEGIVKTGDKSHPLENYVCFIDIHEIAAWLNLLNKKPV